MKILYVPFKIVASVIGARLGHSVFKGLWGAIDDHEPPRPTAVDASFPKIVAAAALEAATLAGVAALVDRTSARVFRYLTGIWPGEETPESPGQDAEGPDEQ